MNVVSRRSLSALVQAAQQYGFILGRGVDNEESKAKHRLALSEAYENFREVVEVPQKLLGYQPK